MIFLDVITAVIFAAAIVVCIWKGFLKILLNLGAFIIAAVIARMFGSSIGGLFFSDLINISSDRFGFLALENINEAIATVIGTVLVFLIFYLVLRIIFAIVSKLVKRADGISAVDRILGAVFGVVMAFGITFVFCELVRITATVVTLIDPNSQIFNVIGDTVIFKYFF